MKGSLLKEAPTTADKSCVRVPVPRPLPCFVILVHGVNDVGTAYQAQDEGLCKGLNARLDRSSSLVREGGDLSPASYRDDFAALLEQMEQVNPAGAAQARADPDSVLFRRTASADTYSPVIPFYWGFSEEVAAIQRDAWHGQWLDRFGNRLDKNGTKGGGPFLNATSNLPDFWTEGVSAAVGKALDGLGRDPFRPAKGNPHRRYMVLAALRLAALIEIIRKHAATEKAAINLMGHSQGCLVSLVAQALIAQHGRCRPADCLILQHPPYSLDETFMEAQLDRGGERQTIEARLATLLNIVSYVGGQRQAEPALADLATQECGKGVAGVHWRAGTGARRYTGGAAVSFAERDNRNRVYLYFNPHDQAVTLLKSQGIGAWGVPDALTALTGFEPPVDDYSGPRPVKRTLQAMNELKKHGFRQRVFAAREKREEKVGALAYSYYELRRAGESTLTYWRRGAAHTPRERRLINGEQLEPPCTPVLGEETLSVDAIDASTALTSDRVARGARPERMADPRAPARHGLPLSEHERPGVRAQLQAELDQKAGANTGDRTTVQFIAPADKGTLQVWRSETPNEMRDRIMQQQQANSFHSSIPRAPIHHERVSAYDVALGAPVPRALENDGWIEYLRAVADWRTNWQAVTDEAASPVDSPLRTHAKDLLRHKNDKKAAHAKTLIDETFTYHSTGKLPASVDAIRAVDLVMTQTDKDRAINEPPRPFKV